MLMKRIFRRSGSGDGYALLSVVGLGTAVVLAVGAVGGYAVQTMQSSGRTQGSNAAIQAAQAGIDDFVARLTANSAYGSAPNTGWQPVAGSTDGAGNPCIGTDVPTQRRTASWSFFITPQPTSYRCPRRCIAFAYPSSTPEWNGSCA